MRSSRLNLIKTKAAATPKLTILGPDNETVSTIINLCKNEELPLKVEDTENNFIESDVYIITGIDNDTRESLIKVIKNVNKNKILLFNADDDDLMEIISFNQCPTVISIGFNSKATITASSMKQSLKGIDFNYCLQRKLTDLNGLVIEPFEYPIEIKQINQKYIYYYLLAITSLLIIGYNMDYIKNRIKNVSIKDEMELLYSFGYYIVDCKLNNINKIDDIFITLQSLEHGDLFIINALIMDMNFINYIESWQNILTIKKVYTINSEAYYNIDLKFDNLVIVKDVKSALKESVKNAKSEDIILIFENGDTNIGNLIYEITIN